MKHVHALFGKMLKDAAGVGEDCTQDTDCECADCRDDREAAKDREFDEKCALGCL